MADLSLCTCGHSVREHFAGACMCGIGQGRQCPCEELTAAPASPLTEAPPLDVTPKICGKCNGAIDGPYYRTRKPPGYVHFMKCPAPLVSLRGEPPEISKVATSLFTTYANAEYKCGRAYGSEEPYAQASRRQQAAREALIAYIASLESSQSAQADELSQVDAILSRRSSLDDKPTRATKIEHAISTAARVDRQAAEIERLNKALRSLSWVLCGRCGGKYNKLDGEHACGVVPRDGGGA